MYDHTHCHREFRPKNFGFRHKRPALFVTPQFGPKRLYLVWTLFLAIYHPVILAVDGFMIYDRMQYSSATYFLYLSRWSYLLLSVSSLVDAIVTVYVFVAAKHILQERESNQSKVEVIMRNKAVHLTYRMMGDFYKIKWYMKVTWVLFTMSTVCGLTSSLIFWILHFIPNLSFAAERLEESATDFGSISLCAVNVFMILLHTWLTAKPFRILHVYIPVSVYFIYFLFTIVYQSASGEPVYGVTDWRDFFIHIGPSVGVVLVIVPVMHVLVYGLVQVRTQVGGYCHLRYKVSRWTIQVNKVKPTKPTQNTVIEDNTQQSTPAYQF